MIIPCLSVRQPWAWGITSARKDIENRTRRFNYRGPILIHAGKAADPDFDNCWNEIHELSGEAPPWLQDIELGGIVGACVLTDCLDPIDHDRGWRQEGCFGLQLAKAIPLPFRAYRGALGLFKIEITPAEAKSLRKAGILPK